MGRNCLLILILLLFVFPVAGQDIDSTKVRPTIFVYNEKDLHFAFDWGGGTGFTVTSGGNLTNGEGLLVGASLNFDVYHILAGYKYNLSVDDYRNTNNYFILGYRYRTSHYMVAAGSGFGWQKIQEAEGNPLKNNGNPITKENTIPIDAQADFIFTDYMAVGLQYNYILSDLHSTYSFMVGLKIGAFRNVK